MAETLPRWAHARGRLSLAEQPSWEAAQATAAKKRDERSRLAAQRRAVRHWGHVCHVANRQGFRHGTPEPSVAAVDAWKAIHAAAVVCQALDVRIRNRPHDWDAEVVAAARRMVSLAQPPLSRAERRRRQHEERKG